MKELSLFTGGGGGVWASKILKHKVIGYVEFEDYPQRIIRARINDGTFDNAPIFSDIRAFLSEGYAASYQGLVDLISGGFPCQPFSSAGKRLGEADPRNMWPSTISTIGIIRPGLIFLENVPDILSSGYFGTILRELAETGFDAKWTVLGVGALGGITKRERLWLLGWDRKKYVHGLPIQRRISLKEHIRRTEPPGNLSNVETSWLMAYGYGGGKDDEVADREHRIKALGNGQVPRVAATAFRLLSQGLIPS